MPGPLQVPGLSGRGHARVSVDGDPEAQFVPVAAGDGHTQALGTVTASALRPDRVHEVKCLSAGPLGHMGADRTAVGQFLGRAGQPEHQIR